MSTPETAMWLRVPSHEVASHMASALREHVAHEDPPAKVAEALVGLARALDECPRDLSVMRPAEVRELAENLHEHSSYRLGVRVGRMGTEAVAA